MATGTAASPFANQCKCASEHWSISLRESACGGSKVTAGKWPSVRQQVAAPSEGDSLVRLADFNLLVIGDHWSTRDKTRGQADLLVPSWREGIASLVRDLGGSTPRLAGADEWPL